MANQMIQIHNATTDEITVREMTDLEQADFNAANAQSIAQADAEKSAALAAKQVAETKLNALGLTTDDLKALGL
jgi:hypothetical protein